MLTVAYLGNFRETFCTESDVAWTLETLGHKVVRLQENQVRADEVLAASLKCDLLIFTHTHGWNNSGDMRGVLATLKTRGIPTAMFHLDLYWGIPARAQRIGVDDYWLCEYVFTADGGHQAEFAARGVNHHWLPPGICERACHDGTPRAELKTDILFVGHRSYHSEYPFRPRLIDWLSSTYGSRFQMWGQNRHVREEPLNDLYASAKITIGDCCFSGTPNYWSDRVPDAVGRGAFLLHPQVSGLDIPLATFKPQDLHDLKAHIDYYLDPAHEDERIAVRDRAVAWVRSKDTYTQRCEHLLKVVFNGLRV